MSNFFFKSTLGGIIGDENLYWLISYTSIFYLVGS